MSPRRRHLLLAARIAAGVAVVVCVAAFARNLRWHAVREAFRAADPELLLTAMILWVPCTTLQAVRWYSLARAVKPVPLLTVLSCSYVGQAASAILPMRAGEAV
ncbi:MAG TPA: lysylphosphatidylglycerol synthase domain-containing protein, partial [Myxococcales bacterium]|nr:lysylphosphatidylglycerol synthase domain-containing protein [Myxococcales bacterium]